MARKFLHAGATRARLTAAAAALIPACASSIAPPSASSAPVLPDLVPDRAEEVRLDSSHLAVSPSGEERLLIRYDGFVHNAGPGTLEVHGSAPVVIDGRPHMTSTFQRVYDGTGLPGEPASDLRRAPAPEIAWEPTVTHQHFHLRNATTYTLLPRAENGQSIDGAKSAVGFCLIDAERHDADAAISPHFLPDSMRECAQYDPGAQSVVMGLSPGWRDRYWGTLDWQWIDASDATPGDYFIHPEADPQDVIVEHDETNNAGATTDDFALTIPGFVAEPVETTTRAAVPTTIRLRARRFESSVPGAAEPDRPTFRIETQPAHGHVLTPPTEWFEQQTVAYVPNAGFRGTDRFSYAARDRADPRFPRRPQAATVEILVRG